MQKLLRIFLLILVLASTSCDSINKSVCKIGIIDTEITEYSQGFDGYDFLLNTKLQVYPYAYKTHGDYICDITHCESINSDNIIYITAISSEKVNSSQKILEAIKYIDSVDIRICNISLSLNENIDELDRSIIESNTLFIVAAGNYGTNLDTDPICYPACFNYDNVITVASVNNNGELMEDSNYGLNSVDIAYYGELDQICNDCQGTSFACARVSAIVYKMLQANPNLTNKDIKEILISCCDQSLEGLVASNGILNKEQAILTATQWQYADN